MLETPNRLIPSPEVRKYVYNILAVLAPVAIAYGLLSGEEAALWLAVAAAVLGAGANALAGANTPKEQAPGSPVANHGLPVVSEEEVTAPEPIELEKEEAIDEPTPVYTSRKARIEAEGR